MRVAGGDDATAREMQKTRDERARNGESHAATEKRQE